MLGIVIVIAGFFVLVAAVSSTVTDEDRAQWAAEREEKEVRQQTIDKAIQEGVTFPFDDGTFQEREAFFEAKKEFEELQTTQMKQLPSSCDGVLTTETWLYPTADKCVEEIGQRFYDWCLSEERKISETGVESRADLCVTDIAVRLVQLCEDPVIGSQELCMMRNMQDLYQNLIPK